MLAGLLTDAVLDAPEFVAARDRFGTTALTDQRYTRTESLSPTGAVSSSGSPCRGHPGHRAAWQSQLYVLYVLAAHTAPVFAWRSWWRSFNRRGPWRCGLADPNPRAQAFYRKHGFLQTVRGRSKAACRRSAWSAACTSSDNSVRARQVQSALQNRRARPVAAGVQTPAGPARVASYRRDLFTQGPT